MPSRPFFKYLTLNEIAMREGTLQAQLSALQTQINPHFVYNTLNIISAKSMESGNYEVIEICDQFAQMLRYATDTRSRTATVNGQTLTLTRKETGILEYLMVHQGRPVSQEELMEHVWDNSVDSFSNSIRVHISALRKKLRAALGYDPVRNRIGEGYLMGGEEA